MHRARSHLSGDREHLMGWDWQYLSGTEVPVVLMLALPIPTRKTQFRGCAYLQGLLWGKGLPFPRFYWCKPQRRCKGASVARQWGVQVPWSTKATYVGTDVRKGPSSLPALSGFPASFSSVVWSQWCPRLWTVSGPARLLSIFPWLCSSSKGLLSILCCSFGPCG